MEINVKILVVLATGLLCACQNTSYLAKPLGCRKPYGILYHPNIVQGNYVTSDVLSRLSPGQSRKQVIDILGTPMIQDPFHAQRWDYVYRLQKCSGEVEGRRVTVFFAEDKMERYEQDNVPDTDHLLIPGNRILTIDKGNKSGS